MGKILFYCCHKSVGTIFTLHEKPVYCKILKPFIYASYLLIFMFIVRNV